ncbi:Mth938-like domain-containing protein [Ruegeria meonggei]|uniref:Mth938-like domain-containing protein n=1 Tax=Ruegeria meonggei TaxID=1446476 RepID=UPI00366BC51B
MRLNEITYNNATPIDGYGPGFFRIGGQIHEGTVLTGPTGTTAWGGYDDQTALLKLNDHVDVLLIGTGAALTHIPKDLRTALENAGIGVEIMNSPAACRTYNVLLSEGRRIALALLPV